MKHTTRGFTVLELLIVLFIVSVVGIGISTLARNIFSFNRYFNNSLSVADSAQRLLRPMGQEIRAAATSSTGSYPIDSFAANDFTFYSDIDSDGLQEKVRYYLSGTSLMKDVTKPTGSPLAYNSANTITTTLITSVQNTAHNTPVFNYYDSTYTGGAGGEVVPGTGSITAIRLVRITLYIDVDPNTAPASPIVTTLVSVRNLKQQN